MRVKLFTTFLVTTTTTTSKINNPRIKSPPKTFINLKINDMVIKSGQTLKSSGIFIWKCIRQ